MRSSTRFFAPVVVSSVLGGLALMPAAVFAQPAAATHFAETTAAPPAPDTDDTVWQLGMTGAFNYGNSRTLALGANTHFMVRRDAHVFTLDLTFTYGMASLRDAQTQQFGPWNANAQNFTGRVRYDLYLDADDAIFAVVAGRNDPFAGLDFRFQAQVGYMRNLFAEHEAQHRIWFEIGADATFDDRYPNPLCGTAPMGVTLDRSTCIGSDAMTYMLPDTEFQPSARLFLGYDNHMNSDWTYLTGVEALIDVRGDPHWGNVRITWNNRLTLRIDSNLEATATLAVFYDGEPVPGHDPLDIQSSLGIQYTLL